MSQPSLRRTRIKICGITQPEQANTAATLGVDAVGLVFYPPSPRAVELQQASEIAAALPAFVSTVALFVNPSVVQVEAVLAAMPIDVLQFHGEESAEFALQFNRPYLTTVKAGEGGSGAASLKVGQHPQASGYLFDKFDPEKIGGTGEVFDWNLFDSSLDTAILAGGLNAANVREAIGRTRPYAVDVSSGVESAPGVKCPSKMRQFVQACRQADEDILKEYQE